MSRACTCDKCVRACSHGNPGWFAPGQVEEAAKVMGLSVDQFRRKYLVRDWWAAHHGDILVWAPVKLGPDGEPLDRPGAKANFGYAWMRGRCSLLGDDDRCRIHSAKPLECAETMVCEGLPRDGSKAGSPLRRRIAAAWAWAARAAARRRA